MKKSILFSFLLLLGFMPYQTYFAQDMKDQLFLIREEVAKVDMWDKYESTSKQWVELMDQAGLNLSSVRASATNDGHYYYLIPINSYADIDNFPEIFGAAVEKIGKDKWSKFIQENEESMVSNRDFVAKWSAKYSYVPKMPRLKSGEEGFIHWIFFTFKLEKRKEVMDILAEWKALYEKNNIPDGWDIWQIDLGLDNNTMVLTEVAKDGESFFANVKENSDKLKDEEYKLWEKFSANITSFKEVYGKPRPDLSYFKK